MPLPTSGISVGRAHGEHFFLLIERELVVIKEMVNFGHCFPMEAIKACVMCGSHMMTGENASHCRVTSQRDMWIRDDGNWTRSKCTSSFEVHEHNEH